MRNFLFTIGVFSLLFLTACGNNEDTSEASSEQAEDSVKGIVEAKDFDKMYTDPLSFKEFEVEFTGQVFVEPERDSDGTYLQVYAKPEQYEQNVLVGIDDSTLEVEADDFVSIKGIVADQFEGENLMGGTITAPVVKAKTVEVVDYITAISPTLKTVEVDQEINQHGFIINVNKIEFADNATRLYVKISNDSEQPISYYTHSTKLVAGSKQLESESNYESGLPKVQSDILPGVESEGVITFPAIDESTESLVFHSKGSSDNYDIRIEPFVFEIDLK